MVAPHSSQRFRCLLSRSPESHGDKPRHTLWFPSSAVKKRLKPRIHLASTNMSRPTFPKKKLNWGSTGAYLETGMRTTQVLSSLLRFNRSKANLFGNINTVLHVTKHGEAWSLDVCVVAIFLNYHHLSSPTPNKNWQIETKLAILGVNSNIPTGSTHWFDLTSPSSGEIIRHQDPSSDLGVERRRWIHE